MSRIVYLNGRFVPEEQAQISVFDRGFVFADGIYEVVRFYQGRFFGMDEHLVRLERSIREIRLPALTVPWHDVFATLLERNGLSATDGIFYVQVTRGVADRDHAFPSPEPQPTVFAYAKAAPRPLEKLRSGVSVITRPDQRWSRCDIKSISLLPNILAQQEAREAGAHEALLVREGIVTEGARSNVAIVKDGVVITHPATQAILAGVERQLVLQVAAQLNIPVEQRPFTVLDLFAADEACLMSTTSEVMGIIHVDGRPIGNGEVGAVSMRLLKGLEDLMVRV